MNIPPSHTFRDGEGVYSLTRDIGFRGQSGFIRRICKTTRMTLNGHRDD